ncbi:hypothetical protein LJC46_03030 [Desulfovibrio sp. OttesenSCG-928-G15]|nr:hypothetical protein [Desulfovibrio sp. OttesenSCG-928-G15]
MFADPTVALMTMLILFFIGMMCMFFIVMRTIGTHKTEMRESFRKQQQVLADIEGQLMDMSFSLRSASELKEAAKPAPLPPKNPLPFLDEGDSILSLLDAPLTPMEAANPPPLPEPSLPNFEDRLFTRPPVAGRTILDDFDLPISQSGRGASYATGRNGAVPGAAPGRIGTKPSTAPGTAPGRIGVTPAAAPGTSPVGSKRDFSL